ncbi:MAG: dipeptidase [Thalassobaculales bacterium]
MTATDPAAWPISEAARRLHADALVWDAHSCLPLAPGLDLEVLERHRAAGVDFVSINVGMDFNPVRQVIRVLAAFRAWVRRHPDRFQLAGSVAEIEAAKAAGRLAVAFDLEGSDMLEGDIDMLALYQDLGVRQMHLAYNRDNAIAGGCHGSGQGLTALGRKVVAEINRLGILIDCSHSSYRTSMDILEMSSRPVVFSHANSSALKPHARNIADDQMRACAATGGVVGITGVGIFLDASHEATTEAYVRHIDYAVQLIGPRHVGFGLDFVFMRGVDDDPPGFNPADWWPAGNEYGAGGSLGALRFATPEQIPELTDALLKRGYAEDDIRGILGLNFRRVARETWGG